MRRQCAPLLDLRVHKRTAPIPAADRSADTNRTLAGSASPARRSAARFHAWVSGLIDLPDHEVAGPGMTPGEGVQARAGQHVIPPALC